MIAAWGRWLNRRRSMARPVKSQAQKKPAARGGRGFSQAQENRPPEAAAAFHRHKKTGRQRRPVSRSTRVYLVTSGRSSSRSSSGRSRGRRRLFGRSSSGRSRSSGRSLVCRSSSSLLSLVSSLLSLVSRLLSVLRGILRAVAASRQQRDERRGEKGTRELHGESPLPWNAVWRAY